MTTGYFRDTPRIRFGGAGGGRSLRLPRLRARPRGDGRADGGHLRVAVARWRSLVWEGGDPFGGQTFERPRFDASRGAAAMEAARRKADAPAPAGRPGGPDPRPCRRLDVLARGLLAATAIVEDGALDRALAERCAGWDGPLGRRIMGGAPLAEIAGAVTAARLEPAPRPAPRSGRRPSSTASSGAGSGARGGGSASAAHHFRPKAAAKPLNRLRARAAFACVSRQAARSGRSS